MIESDVSELVSSIRLFYYSLGHQRQSYKIFYVSYRKKTITIYVGELQKKLHNRIYKLIIFLMVK